MCNVRDACLIHDIRSKTPRTTEEFRNTFEEQFCGTDVHMDSLASTTCNIDAVTLRVRDLIGSYTEAWHYVSAQGVEIWLSTFGYALVIKATNITTPEKYILYAYDRITTAVRSHGR